MRINNVSNVSFKSVYAVDEGEDSQGRWLQRFLQSDTEITETGTLFKVLNPNDSNPLIRLMKDGGMFGKSSSAGSMFHSFADGVNIIAQPLILVDDETGRPVQELDAFVKGTEVELSTLDKIDADALRAKLTEKELREVEERFQRGVTPPRSVRGLPLMAPYLAPEGSNFYTREFLTLERVRQKIRDRAAGQYKALYAKLASGEVIKLPKDSVELAKQFMQRGSAIEWLARFRK